MSIGQEPTDKAPKRTQSVNPMIDRPSIRAFLTDVFWFAGALAVTAICADYRAEARAAEAARLDTVRDLARLETIAGDLATELAHTQTPIYEAELALHEARVALRQANTIADMWDAR